MSSRSGTDSPDSMLNVSNADSSAKSLSSNRHRKSCAVAECTKVNAGRGFCISHGGGKKCMSSACLKGAQAGGYCREHGGGARCQVIGCDKVNAGKGLCRAHGGGRRCQNQDCNKADVGGGFCTAHGGGKRCAIEGCSKIDQGGGKCRAHGGVKRCNTRGCEDLARGSNGRCSKHGGAQLCAQKGCRRLAKRTVGLAGFCKSCAADRMVKSARDAEKEDETDTCPNLISDWPSPQETEAFGPLFLSDSDDNDNSSAAAVADTSSVLNLTDAKATPTGWYGTNCLLNGCNRSFGGDCNCQNNCECNTAAEAIGSKNARQSNKYSCCSTSCNSLQIGSESELTTKDSSTCESLECLEVQVFQPQALDLYRVIGLLRVLPRIRSAHVLRLGLEEPPIPALIAIRAYSDLDRSILQTVWKMASALEGSDRIFTITKRTAVSWSLREIALHVPSMMCLQNCGTTVVNSLLSDHTEDESFSVNLVFAERLLICRGHSLSNEDMLRRIELVGYAATIKYDILIPKEHRFGLVEFMYHEVGQKIRRVLRDVEGVEDVALDHSTSEVLVSGFILDPTELIEAAAKHQLILVSTVNSHDEGTSVGKDLTVQVLEDADEMHICDDTCSQNGCQQYMATIAHTAALAVGWVVPGCAMSWGGECTCGEDCKCNGCPKHNPAGTIM